LYVVFSVYLHLPYIKTFASVDYLLVINLPAAAIGCFVLSRRWVTSFAGSFFAGAIYGFGPFVLFLGRFHPTAGSIAALVPWLFLPAASAPYGKLRWLRIPLVALPFAGIISLFLLAGWSELYPVPTQIRIRPDELLCLLAPAALAGKAEVLIGFYHVPVASLIIGTAMLLAARRYGTVIVLVTGLVLSFCPVIFGVSAIMWLTVPLVCCSVLIGEGADGLIHAGYNDRKWVLSVAIVLLVAAVVTLLLGTKCAQIFAGLGLKYTRLFAEAAKMYILGAIAMGIIFFLAKGKTRLLWLRTVVFCAAMGVDLFLGARYIILQFPV